MNKNKRRMKVKRKVKIRESEWKEGKKVQREERKRKYEIMNKMEGRPEAECRKEWKEYKLR